MHSGCWSATGGQPDLGTTRFVSRARNDAEAGLPAGKTLVVCVQLSVFFERLCISRVVA